jgi:hypothetical protein
MGVFQGMSSLAVLRTARHELSEQPTLLDNIADYSLPCTEFGAGVFFIAAYLTQGMEAGLVYQSRALWNKKSLRAQRLKARQEARKTVLDSSTQTSLTSTTTAPMPVTSQQSAGGMQSVGRRP